MQTKFDHWELLRLEDIRAEAFYQLVKTNKDFIEKGFPVTVSRCASLEKTIAFLKENTEKVAQKEGYYFYLRHLQTQKLIGYFCVKNLNFSIYKAELAYFIDQDFANQGIVSGVLPQILDFCFETLGMNKVFICTSRHNLASQRVAEKLGFKNEGLLRQEFRNESGVLEDIYYFGLLKSDYYER